MGCRARSFTHTQSSLEGLVSIGTPKMEAWLKWFSFSKWWISIFFSPFVFLPFKDKAASHVCWCHKSAPKCPLSLKNFWGWNCVLKLTFGNEKKTCFEKNLPWSSFCQIGPSPSVTTKYNSRWFQAQSDKYAQVKLDHFSQYGKNQQIFEEKHLESIFTHLFHFLHF